MRVMAIVRLEPDPGAHASAGEAWLAGLARFNEALAKAGVLLAGEGVDPGSTGTRLRFSGSHRTVIAGPSIGSGQQIAGFSLLQVRCMEEAVEWIRRCPNPCEGHSEIEILQVFEADGSRARRLAP
ncbi:MAG: YciI family protein [Lysobacteraceae bacterium]|nr:MAG: YciI family protein [Xanthomonadaceae bacterium]